MDDLYLDALGIADEVDRLGLKGSKKKKGKKLDEDFVVCCWICLFGCALGSVGLVEGDLGCGC